MDALIDLDAAAEQIKIRRDGWRRRGIKVGELTWREVGEGWPPPIKTSRADVLEADSVGVTLRKVQQEGSIVLFCGGWADFLYWNGVSDVILDEAPGWEDWLTIDRFGSELDRLAGLFT